MRILILLSLALMSGLSLAPAQENRTADYYLNKPERYLGKKITLNCAYVNRVSDSFNTDPQYVMFDAYTYGRGSGYLSSSSGYISVRVPVEIADKFASKYGHTTKWDGTYNVNTRPMSGTFSKSDSTYFLDYEASK